MLRKLIHEWELYKNDSNGSYLSDIWKRTLTLILEKGKQQEKLDNLIFNQFFSDSKLMDLDEKKALVVVPGYIQQTIMMQNKRDRRRSDQRSPGTKNQLRDRHGKSAAEDPADGSEKESAGDHGIKHDESDSGLHV